MNGPRFSKMKTPPLDSSPDRVSSRRRSGKTQLNIVNDLSAATSNSSSFLADKSLLYRVVAFVTTASLFAHSYALATALPGSLVVDGDSSNATGTTENLTMDNVKRLGPDVVSGGANSPPFDGVGFTGKKGRREDDLEVVRRLAAPLRRLHPFDDEDDEDEHHRHKRKRDGGIDFAAPLMAFRLQREQPHESCRAQPGVADEKRIRQLVEDMLLRGLGQGGFNLIILDDCWVLPERDSEGKLQINGQRFPSGFTTLAHQLRAKGFYLGVSLAAHDDSQKCPSELSTMVRGRETEDLQQLLELGISHVTLKHCGAKEEDYHHFTTRIADFVTGQGNSNFGLYCDCPRPEEHEGAGGTTEFAEEFWADVVRHCDSWAIPDEHAFETEWQKLVWRDSLFEHDHNFAEENDERRRFDLGPLFIESQGMSPAELRTAVALRLVTGAPIILEGHPEAARWRPELLDTLKSDVVMMAARDGDDPSAVPKEIDGDALQLWQRATPNRQILSALVNITDQPHTHTIHWQDFYAGFAEKMEGVSNCSVEDVWGKKQFLDASSLADAGATVVTVDPHDTLLIRMTPRVSMEDSTEVLGIPETGSMVKRKMTRETFRDENGEVTGSVTFGKTSIIQPSEESEEGPGMILPFRPDDGHGFLHGPVSLHATPSFTARPSLRGLERIHFFGGLPGPPSASLPGSRPGGLLSLLGLKLPTPPALHPFPKPSEMGGPEKGVFDPFMSMFPKFLEKATDTLAKEEKLLEKEIQQESEEERTKHHTEDRHPQHLDSGHDAATAGDPHKASSTLASSGADTLGAEHNLTILPPHIGTHQEQQHYQQGTGSQQQEPNAHGTDRLLHYLRTAALFLIFGMLIGVLVTFSRNILDVTKLFSRKGERAFQLEVVADRPHSS